VESRDQTTSDFYDLDGHHWELAWMDPKALER
jgi:uncharacterized protein